MVEYELINRTQIRSYKKMNLFQVMTQASNEVKKREQCTTIPICCGVNGVNRRGSVTTDAMNVTVFDVVSVAYTYVLSSRVYYSIAAFLFLYECIHHAIFIEIILSPLVKCTTSLPFVREL